MIELLELFAKLSGDPVLKDQLAIDAPALFQQRLDRPQGPLPEQLRLRGRSAPGRFPAALYRLRYGGSTTYWGFAIYLASNDAYEDSVLPTGRFTALLKRPWIAPACYGAN